VSVARHEASAEIMKQMKKCILVGLGFCLLLGTTIGLLILVKHNRDRKRVAEALRRNDVPGLRALLEHHPEILHATSRYGSTLLLDAGSSEMIEFLVAQGADVRARSSFGTTALHGAALRGQLDVIHLLLQKGADVNATEMNGSTPLHNAAWNGTWRVGEDVMGGPPPYQGKGKVIEALLAAGADIDARTTSGETPLHVAVTSGGIEEVRALLAKGAQVTCRDNDGRTALHALAATPGNPHAEQIARLIIDYGADMEAKDTENSWSPLYYAAENDNLPALRVLLEAGANPNTRDAYGCTPLHRGAYHADVVRLLLENGADIDAATKDGQTIWTLACPEVASILPEYKKAEPKAP
jgi:ankyrin repeat protein